MFLCVCLRAYARVCEKGVYVRERKRELANSLGSCSKQRDLKRKKNKRKLFGIRSPSLPEKRDPLFIDWCPFNSSDGE